MRTRQAAPKVLVEKLMARPAEFAKLYFRGSMAAFTRMLKLPLQQLTGLLALLYLLSACASTPASLEEQAPALSQTDGPVACLDLAVTESKTLRADNIQVVSWNMLKGSLPGWRKDLRRISDGAHLVLLQEAPLIPELTEQAPEGWNWQFAPGYKRAQLQTGVMSSATATASRYCTVRHTEPWLRSPKAMLTTYYEIEGQTDDLLVANIHAINFVLGTRAYRRQLQALTDLLAEHQGPIIVGGDFNDWSDKRSQTISDLFQPLGLRQVQFESPDRITVFGRNIDHIYYRGLAVTSQNVFRVISSDHNPIRVGFSLLKH